MDDRDLIDTTVHDFAESIMDYAEQVTPHLRPTDFSPLIARKAAGRGYSRLMVRRPALHGWALMDHRWLALLLEADQTDGLLEQCDAAVYLLGSGTKSLTTPRWFAVELSVIRVRLGSETGMGRRVSLTACTGRTLDFLA